MKRNSILILLLFLAGPSFSQGGPKLPKWNGYAFDTLYYAGTKVWAGFAFVDTIPRLLPYPPEPDLHLPPASPELNTSNVVYSAGLMLVSGAAHGVSETLTWHYDRFQARHPSALPGKWDPRVSWVNKYKTDRHGNILQPQRPAYFGSTTFLVWTTDGYHGFNMLSRITGAAGLTIPLWTGSGKKLRHYVAEIAGKGLIWSAGFHATYTLFY